MSIKNKMIEYILSQLKDYQEEGMLSENIAFKEDTELYSKDGILSSLILVTLVVDIEDYIAEKFNKQVTIADDKAFSQARSPFKTVATLAEYVDNLVNK